MSIQYYANQHNQDDVKALFGDSGDLQIYHDGSNSYIKDVGTGDLYIEGGNNIIFQDENQSRCIIINTSASVDLFYADVQRLSTTNTGISVTGGAVVAGAMSSFETTLTNNNDYSNSPISILERGNVSSSESADKYAPNLNFHWGGRVSNSFWMAANGTMNYGSYTSAGIPALNGTFAAGNLVAATAVTGNTGAFTGQVTGPTPTTTTSFANKAYVDAQTSGIGGSGTINTIPLFTPDSTTLGSSAMSQANIGTGNAKRITVSQARMTITGSGGDADGGTLNLTANSARLGIATDSYPGSITEPEASLDVGKNARIRGSLNVGETNEQYLFVSSDEDTPVGYVKMGYYGTGTDYDLSGGAQSSVQYTSGFSNGGKVCEDERIMTFKLTRTQMGNLVGTGQKTLIAQDSNFNYIVKEAYMYQVNSGGGEAPLFSSYIAIQYQSSHGGVTAVDNAFELSSTILNQTKKKRKVMVFDQKECAQVGLSDVVPRAAVVLMTGATPSNTGSGTVDYYLRLRVKNIDFNDDIKNNSQLITVT